MGRSFGKNVHHRLPDVWTFKPGFYPAQAGKLEGNKSGKTSPCHWPRKLDLLRGKLYRLLHLQCNQTTQPNETTHLGTFSNCIFYQTQFLLIIDEKCWVTCDHGIKISKINKQKQQANNLNLLLLKQQDYHNSNIS